MQKALITVILITIPFITGTPQNNGNQPSNDWKKYIHIEAGAIYPEGTIRESLPVRQNISYYNANQYANGSISSETSGLIFGIRYEYFLPRFKSGISTGLRFTGLNTEISGYTSSISDFFYLRYSMQDSDTKFARVKSIKEVNYLLSVPLELRFIPFSYKNFSVFAKAGIEYSVISLMRGADIKFQNDDMDIHEDKILADISEPTNKHYSVFYSSIGVKLGQEGKLNYSIEVLLPSFFLTRNNLSLIDLDYFEGFKLSVQFPVKKNKQAL